MSKPFLIVQVTDGELGVIHQRDTWEEAVNIGVKLAMEQNDDNDTEEDIRKEFEEDSDWATLYGDIVISIVQTED